MWIAIIFVLLGVALLWAGGESLVRGAVKLALDLGVTPLVVGLTVVAMTTSLPEGFASVAAMWRGGLGDVALGNVIGSNIANLGLVLGIAICIQPLEIPRVIRSREMPLVAVVSILLLLVMALGPIGWIKGLILLCGMVAYTLFQLQHKTSVVLEQKLMTKLSITKELLMIVLGLALLLIGADLLVQGSVRIANLFDLSDRVIGLTIVAIGSSCPEIATVIVAAMHRRGDLILGNILGSNIYNVLMVVPLASFFGRIDFSIAMLKVDVPVMLGFTALVWALIHFRLRCQRWHGALLLALYLLYLVGIGHA